MNLLHYDEWKDTDAVETLTYFLDSVMTEFITKCKDSPFMEAAANFADNQRALGIGVLGWHSLLQSKMISFESMPAKFLNTEIHKIFQEKTQYATEQLAEVYGEPPLLEGYGKRNVTTMAIAPTTSSSFILGQVSPSIEPLTSIYFVKDLVRVLYEPHEDTVKLYMAVLAHHQEQYTKSVTVDTGKTIVTMVGDDDPTNALKENSFDS